MTHGEIEIRETGPTHGLFISHRGDLTIEKLAEALRLAQEPGGPLKGAEIHMIEYGGKLAFLEPAPLCTDALLREG